MKNENLILSNLPENEKNKLIEELRDRYGDALINDILNNVFEEDMHFFYNDILLR